MFTRETLHLVDKVGLKNFFLPVLNCSSKDPKATTSQYIFILNEDLSPRSWITQHPRAHLENTHSLLESVVLSKWCKSVVDYDTFVPLWSSGWFLAFIFLTLMSCYLRPRSPWIVVIFCSPVLHKTPQLRAPVFKLMELIAVHFQCRVLARKTAATRDKAAGVLKAYGSLIVLHYYFTFKINYVK